MFALSVLALVSFAGCKSMQPKPGKPAVSKTDIKPPTPPSFETDTQRRLNENDLAEQERLNELAAQQALVGSQFGFGPVDPAVAVPGAVGGIDSFPVATGAFAPTSAFDTSGAGVVAVPGGENGSIAAPLPDGLVGAAVGVQDQQVACAGGVCPSSRRSSVSAGSALTHGIQ